MFYNRDSFFEVFNRRLVDEIPGYNNNIWLNAFDFAFDVGSSFGIENIPPRPTFIGCPQDIVAATM